MKKLMPITITKIISDWTVRLEFVNRYKNLFIVFVQITTFCGVFGVSLKNAFGYSLGFMVLYFVVAYLADKTGLRKQVGKSDFTRNQAWLDMMEQIDRIEAKLENLSNT